MEDTSVPREEGVDLGRLCEEETSVRRVAAALRCDQESAGTLVSGAGAFVRSLLLDASTPGNLAEGEVRHVEGSGLPRLLVAGDEVDPALVACSAAMFAGATRELGEAAWRAVAREFLRGTSPFHGVAATETGVGSARLTLVID